MSDIEIRTQIFRQAAENLPPDPSDEVILAAQLQVAIELVAATLRQRDFLDPSTRQLQPGDVVQIDPDKHPQHDGFWAGNLLVVEEVKSWGVQGYCRTERGRAYLRLETGSFTRVGRLHFVPEVSPEKKSSV